MSYKINLEISKLFFHKIKLTNEKGNHKKLTTLKKRKNNTEFKKFKKIIINKDKMLTFQISQQVYEI